MKKIIATLLITLLAAPVPALAAGSRIKDITNVEGVRENILIGYGLVVGLNGTGDKLNNTAFTEKKLTGLFGAFGR